MGCTADLQGKGEVENMEAPLDNKLQTYSGRHVTHVEQPQNNAKSILKCETHGEQLLHKTCMHCAEGMVSVTVGF